MVSFVPEKYSLDRIAYIEFSVTYFGVILTFSMSAIFGISLASTLFFIVNWCACESNCQKVVLNEYFWVQLKVAHLGIP